MFEPCVADRHGAVRRAENHVEEMLAPEHLADPAIVLDEDRAAERFEMSEDARVVARLAKYVEVLRLPRHAGIGAERESAGEQEGNARSRQLANGLGVEGLRFGILQCRLRPRPKSGAAIRTLRNVFDHSGRLDARAERQAKRARSGEVPFAAAFTAKRRRNLARPPGPLANGLLRRY